LVSRCVPVSTYINLANLQQMHCILLYLTVSSCIRTYLVVSSCIPLYLTVSHRLKYGILPKIHSGGAPQWLLEPLRHGSLVADVRLKVRVTLSRVANVRLTPDGMKMKYRRDIPHIYMSACVRVCVCACVRVCVCVIHARGGLTSGFLILSATAG